MTCLSCVLEHHTHTHTHIHLRQIFIGKEEEYTLVLCALPSGASTQNLITLFNGIKVHDSFLIIRVF